MFKFRTIIIIFSLLVTSAFNSPRTSDCGFISVLETIFTNRTPCGFTRDSMFRLVTIYFKDIQQDIVNLTPTKTTSIETITSVYFPSEDITSEIIVTFTPKPTIYLPSTTPIRSQSHPTATRKAVDSTNTPIPSTATEIPTNEPTIVPVTITDIPVEPSETPVEPTATDVPESTPTP